MNTISNIYRSVTVLLILVVGAIAIHAQKDEENVQKAEIRKRIDKTQAAVNTLDDETQVLVDVGANPTPSMCEGHCVRKARLRVRLFCQDGNGLYRNGAETQDISIVVKPIGTYLGGTVYAPAGVNRTLTIDVDNTTLQNESVTEYDITADHPFRCPLGVADARTKYGVEIVGAVDMLGIPVDLRPTVYLEVQLIEEHEDQPKTVCSGGNPPNIVAKLPGEGGVCVEDEYINRVNLEWTFQECADEFPMYEVQILRLYNQYELYRTSIEKCRDVVDWSRAISIPIYGDARNLKVTLAEGTGYYVWRVRAIGNAYPNYLGDSRNWGCWTSAPTQGQAIDLSNALVTDNLTGINDDYGNGTTTGPVFFYKQFDEDKNWQYSRIFFEGHGGKPGVLESMTYATSLLQPIQIQRAHAETHDVLVQHSVVDYHGRPSLSTLAVPKIKEEISGAPGTYEDAVLAYHEKVAANTANTEYYGAKRFDKDSKLLNPDAMGGLAEDYWANHPDPRTPEAEGYPFSRTLFQPDPLNREQERSDVGKYLKLGTGHTIRTEYATVSEPEVVSLFGKEAPADTSVVKVINTDQNGMKSVSYQIKDGKVIATCFVDNGASGVLHELDDKGNTNAVNISDTLRGGVNEQQYRIVQQQEFTVLTDGQLVTLNYDMVPGKVEVECMGLCKTCDYTITISVRKKSDNSLVFDEYTYDLAQATCPGGTPTGTTRAWTNVAFSTGTYVVTRTLVPKAVGSIAALDNIKSIIRTDFNADVKTALQSMFNGGYPTDYLQLYLDGAHFDDESIVKNMLKVYESYRAENAFLSIGDCCTISLPEAGCQDGCGAGFKGYKTYLMTYVKSQAWKDSVKFTPGGALLTNTDWDKLTTYFFAPDGVTKQYGALDDTARLNNMIAAMRAAGYDCEQLWACWTNAVHTFKQAALERYDSDGASGPASPSPFYVPRKGFSFMDYFLECAGTKYCGVEQTNTNSWLDNAWNVVWVHNPPTVDEADIMTTLLYDPMSADWTCTLDEEHNKEVNARYTELKKWLDAQRYKTTFEALARDARDANPDLEDFDESTVNTTVIGDSLLHMSEQCRTKCEDRADDFKLSIVKMYMQNGYWVEGYSSGTAEGSVISAYQLSCAAHSLVEQCKKDCSLDPVTFDAYGNVTHPTMVDFALYQQARYAPSFSVQIPDGETCGEGYRYVNIESHAGDILVDLLNIRLEAQRKSMPTSHGTFDVKLALAAIEYQLGDMGACLDDQTMYRVHLARDVESYFKFKRTGETCTLSYYEAEAKKESEGEVTHFLVKYLNDLLDNGWGKQITDPEAAAIFGATPILTTSVFHPATYYSIRQLNTPGPVVVPNNDKLRPPYACDVNGLTYYLPPGGVLPNAYDYWAMCPDPMLPCVNGSLNNFAALFPNLRIFSTATFAYKATPTTPGWQVYGDVVLDICGRTFGYGLDAEAIVPATPSNLRWKVAIRMGEPMGIVQMFDNVVDRSELGQIGIGAKFTETYGYFRKNDEGRLQFVNRTIDGPGNTIDLGCIGLACAPPAPEGCGEITICNLCTKVQCSELCFKWEPKLDFVPLRAMKSKSCARMAVDRLMTYLNGAAMECLERTIKSAEISYNTSCFTPSNIKDKLVIKRTEPYYHYTLYYYDRAGNCVRTVPPKGFVPLTGVNVTRLNNTSHTMVTSREYNSLSQLVSQTTPDEGLTRYWYDVIGRSRVSQTAKQYPGKYSVMDYDALGRIVRSGEVTSASSGQTLADLDPVASPLSGAFLMETKYTTAAVLPAPYAALTQRFIQNRVSYSISDEDGSAGTTTDRTATYYSYDPHGNVEWTVTSIPGMTSPVKTEYEYDLISGKLLQVNYQRGYPDQFFTRMTYDHDNEVVAAHTSRDSVIWEQEAAYTYNTHRSLQRTEIGQDKVSGVDYAYTLQGWIKGINHPSLEPEAATDDGGASSVIPRDAFGMVLGYYATDFTRTGSSFDNGDAYAYAGAPLYNGNISSWVTNHMKMDNTADGALASLFGYDKRGRLVADTGVTFNAGGSPAAWNAKPAAIGTLGSTYHYDPNGNLTALIRVDKSGALIDNLTYTYALTGTNKLTHVDDAVTAGSYTKDVQDQAASNYQYDATGNVTSDVLDGIAANMIVWTPSNKVRTITTTTELISNLYDETGNRIRQRCSTFATGQIKTTYYVYDVSRSNLQAIYEQIGTGDVTVSEWTIASRNKIGVLHGGVAQSLSALAPVTIYKRYLGVRDYQLNDHLGNVRSTFTDYVVAGTLAPFDNVMSMYADYFPFGMVREDRSDNTTSYKYGYNGQLRTDQLGNGNHTTATFWEYDTRLGRRWNIDPIPVVGVTGYSAQNDNPILYSDILGDKPTALEGALIAEHVYSGKGRLDGGWEPMSRMAAQDQFGVDPFHDESGLKSAIYTRTVDGKTEYVYAFAGTEAIIPVFLSKDGNANYDQLFGQSEQYMRALANATTISQILGGAELTFVGHSLGGGEAAASAYSTGRSAVTYNPAGLSNATFDYIKSKYGFQCATVDAHILLLDPLTKFQDYTPAPNTNGTRHWYSPESVILTPSLTHSMLYLIQALDEQNEGWMAKTGSWLNANVTAPIGNAANGVIDRTGQFIRQGAAEAERRILQAR